MNRAVLAAGILFALGVFCYVGPVNGQTPNNPPVASSSAAPAGARIAILNLTYVINNYVKFQHYKEEIKGLVEPLQKKHMDLQQKLEELSKAAAALPRQGQSSQGEELEKQARDIKRQMEDNKAEANLKMSKRSDEEMKIIYLDVYRAVQGYAASHRFDLVLHYNDALTPEDFLSAQNIARKLNTGALMPLIMAPSMDISKDIVEVLNAGMGVSNGAPQGTAQPVGGTH